MERLRISIGAHATLVPMLLSCAFSCSAPGEGGNIPSRALSASDLDAPEILRRCADALGGQDALASPRPLRKRSRIRLHPEGSEPVDGELRYFVDDSGSERLEVHTESGSSLIQIARDGRAREWAEGEPSDRDATGDVERRALHRSLVRRLLHDDPVPATLLGVEASASNRQYVFQQQLPTGDRWRLWIDAESFLPTRILCSSAAEGDPRIQQDFLFDYRWIGPRRVPFRQVTTSSGRKVSEAWVLEYEIDPTLDPRLFDLDSLFSR